MTSANRLTADKPRAKNAPKTAFKPGQSGNPSGRRKKTEQEFALELACEARAPEALETILAIMRIGQSDNVRLTAAAFIIERRYGKAVDRREDVTDPLKKAMGNMSPERAEELMNALDQVQAVRNKAKT